MFTAEAQAAIDRAKDAAVSRGESQLTLGAVATSVALDRRGAQLLS